MHVRIKAHLAHPPSNASKLGESWSETRSTSVLTKNPISPSSSGRVRLAMG